VINILLNNQPLEIKPNSTLQELVEQRNQQQCAVAINENFVPKGLYQQTRLQEGDRIEILVPMQGG